MDHDWDEKESICITERAMMGYIVWTIKYLLYYKWKWLETMNKNSFWNDLGYILLKVDLLKNIKIIATHMKIYYKKWHMNIDIFKYFNFSWYIIFNIWTYNIYQSVLQDLYTSTYKS